MAKFLISAPGALGTLVETRTEIDKKKAGAGNGQILIHQFQDETVEATAFEAGSLDLMDWPPPRTFINRWTGTGAGNIVTQGKAGLQKLQDIGMFQMDINSWNNPTTDKSLRQAMGYLVDRQFIVLNAAGGLAVPICAGTAPGQPGSLNCVQIGYPTSFGEFNPTKALQVLYEGGWRDVNPANGILESPKGGEPTLIFIVRLDDNIRRQAGDQLTNALRTLPGSFTAKTGGTVTVCAGSCQILVDERVIPRSQAAGIVFTAPFKDWHIYTGGWSLGLDPDHMYFLYGSQDAPVHCGGGWPEDFPNNYGCYVDAVADAKMADLVTGQSYNEIIASAQDSQRYMWGYASGKITGTMPTVPIYGRVAQNAFYNTNAGVDTNVQQCWKGWLGQEIGGGLGQITANTVGTYLYNCQDSKPGYVSYKGTGVMDWGFKSEIQAPNPVTYQWLWDALLLQQIYDSCLTRNPAKLAEIIPSMCENFGEGRYFNTALGREATVATFKFRDGIQFSDGHFATANDWKFSAEYQKKNFGNAFGNVNHIIRIDVKDADPKAGPALGKGGTAHVYFDDIGALFTQSAGFIFVLPKHIWCPDYDPSIGNDVGRGVAPRPGCPFPDANLFPHLQGIDPARPGPILQIGSGSHMFVPGGCTGVSCVETIRLDANPIWDDKTRWWNLPAQVSVNADVDQDDQVNFYDKLLLGIYAAVNPNKNPADVDFRIVDKKSQTFTNALGPGTITITERGPHIDDTDFYIIDRLIADGQQKTGDKTGIVWVPGGRAAYNWPDIDKDNDVDLDDLIGVYLRQFQNPTNQANWATQLYMDDVDYDGDIDIDDLIITFVRQFTKPPGAVKP
jgi:ABC-type transport system substrate-binding protein